MVGTIMTIKSFLLLKFTITTWCYKMQQSVINHSAEFVTLNEVICGPVYGWYQVFVGLMVGDIRCL